MSEPASGAVSPGADLAAAEAPEPTAIGRRLDSGRTLEHALRDGRLIGTCDEIPAIALVTVIAALFSAWALRAHVSLDGLFLWIAALIGVAGARVYLALRCRADAQRAARARLWVFRFNALVTVAGLLWAYVPISIGMVDDGAGKIIATAIVVAIPAFALVSQRFLAAGAIGLVVAFLGSYVVFLLAFSAAPYRIEVAAGCAVYALALAVVSLRVEKASVELLAARYRNERFVEELQSAKTQAETAIRIKTEFLANISHELRTPLTVVLGVAQLLKLTQLDAEQRESVSMIERSGESLLALINQILDLSRTESGRLELDGAEFDLHASVEGIRAVLAGDAAQKGLEFTVRIAPSIPRRVRGDEMRLRQVLRNLCDNAIKFTASGRVEVAVDWADEPVAPDRVALRFTVKDTGIGMDKAAIAGAFEPFFQADGSATRHYGGTGLGLAISRRLVRLMGGTISLRSEVGRGSEFTFTAVFERVAGEDAAAAAAPQNGAAPQAKLAARALLVEDDPVNALVSGSMLKTIVQEIDRVEGGEEALRAVAQRRYDVILMDCLMPGMDGFEATRRIRELEHSANMRRSYVIALTASSLPEDRERCIAAGMDAFIRKPYRLEDLRSTVLHGLGLARRAGG